MHDEEIFDEEIFSCAAKNGSLKVLEWAEDSGYDLKSIFEGGIPSDVVRNGQLDVIKFMRNLRMWWGASAFSAAVEGGNLDQLRWMYAGGCPMDQLACLKAASAGHLDVLKWLRGIQCPWNQYTCAYAALNGHFELLKWARASGCQWDEGTVNGMKGLVSGQPREFLGSRGRPPRNIEMGQGKWLSVEFTDLRKSRRGRLSGSAKMGQNEWLSMRRMDLPPRCRWGAS